MLLCSFSEFSGGAASTLSGCRAHLLFDGSGGVKELTPLCLTWAVWQIVTDWCVFALASTRGVSEQGETRGSD